MRWMFRRLRRLADGLNLLMRFLCVFVFGVVGVEVVAGRAVQVQTYMAALVVGAVQEHICFFRQIVCRPLFQ